MKTYKARQLEERMKREQAQKIQKPQYAVKAYTDTGGESVGNSKAERLKSKNPANIDAFVKGFTTPNDYYDYHSKLRDKNKKELEWYREHNDIDRKATAHDEQGNIHSIYDNAISNKKKQIRLHEEKMAEYKEHPGYLVAEDFEALSTMPGGNSRKNRAWLSNNNVEIQDKLQRIKQLKATNELDRQATGNDPYGTPHYENDDEIKATYLGLHDAYLERDTGTGTSYKKFDEVEWGKMAAGIVEKSVLESFDTIRLGADWVAASDGEDTSALSREYDARIYELAENVRGNKTAEFIDKYGTVATGALMDYGLSALTGGASAMTTGLNYVSDLANSSPIEAIGLKVRKYFENAAKDPGVMYDAAKTFVTGYYEAKRNGSPKASEEALAKSIVAFLGDTAIADGVDDGMLTELTQYLAKELATAGVTKQLMQIYRDNPPGKSQGNMRMFK